jgi:SSS family solute:Na+ symporter
VSLATPPPKEAQLVGLTYASVTPAQKKENRASWGAPEVMGTVVVLGLVAVIYLYFSFWLG